MGDFSAFLLYYWVLRMRVLDGGLCPWNKETEDYRYK